MKCYRMCIPLKEDVRPVFEDITFEKLLMKNNAKCRASEQLQLEATQKKYAADLLCRGKCADRYA